MSTFAAVKQFVKRDFAPTWRWLFNASSTVRYRAHRPGLSVEAARIVAELNRSGGSTSSVGAVTGDDSLLDELSAEADGLIAAQQQHIDERRAMLSRDDSGDAYLKPYLVQLMGADEVLLSGREALLRLATRPEMLAVAQAYYGMTVKVGDVNIWLNLQSRMPPGRSTLWHRDLPEDHRILKAFVYLRETGPGNGALEFIPGTAHRSARRDAMPSTFDGTGHRFQDHDVEHAYPVERRARFSGQRGTLVFTDTVGIHRGGWAQTDDRLLCQILYVSGSTSRKPVLRWAADHAPTAADRFVRALGASSEVRA